VPVVVTRASNNYGPYQFPEKVIPLFVTHAIDDIPVPLYGDGLNVRDWLHVDDHCRAVDFLLERGRPGETYNVGGGNEVPNIELTKRILSLSASRRASSSACRTARPRPALQPRLREAARDGLGAARCRSRMAWRAPVAWYRQHEAWWRPLKEADPAFREHYRRHYGER
jgi:dTDP-glucose 4,6-dehydratase